MTEYADYAEILRLHRKFRTRHDEPLWVTFVMLGQQMERLKTTGEIDCPCGGNDCTNAPEGPMHNCPYAR